MTPKLFCGGKRPCRRAQRQADPDTYRGENPAELEAAAHGGDPAAAYKLGMVHHYGLAGQPHSYPRAARYFALAADHGHAWVQYRLGRWRCRGRACRAIRAVGWN